MKLTKEKNVKVTKHTVEENEKRIVSHLRRESEDKAEEVTLPIYIVPGCGTSQTVSGFIFNNSPL